MENCIRKAIVNRRTYYTISNVSPVNDSEIEDIIAFAVKNTPSAFNSQTARLVLLLGDNHKQLWNIVKETLRKIVPEKSFAATENKIDTSFAAGYGTVLFFEDHATVKALQDKFPLYASNFPVWSEHTSAMHQFVVWTLLEDAGFGASLQHYNPLIDDEVKSRWNLPKEWHLVAQMPFGKPTAHPTEKVFNPLNERMFVFK